MLVLYLSFLLAGGLLLGLSLLGGAESDADVDVDSGLEVDADVDVDALHADAEADGEGMVAVARFLSVRDLVFFAAFFGLTGTLLSLLHQGATATLAASLGAGVLAAVAVHKVVRFLKRSETGAPPGPAALAGAPARVVVGLDRDRPGKVDVAAGDRTELLVARVHRGSALDRFHPGDTVVIVRLQDGVALVAEKTFLA
jgi:membrane protein implicated in regulation of membrane protease activity